MPESDATFARTKRELTKMQHWLPLIKEDLVKYKPENFNKLSQREKNLCEKAFSSNINDPDYRSLSKLTYQDGDIETGNACTQRRRTAPIRNDVKTGKLPTVSWLVAPENFSDHPGAPWYGAWYISEVMDILTQNPEVWKKQFLFWLTMKMMVISTTYRRSLRHIPINQNQEKVVTASIHG